MIFSKKTVVLMLSTWLFGLSVKAETYEFDSKVLEMTGLENIDLSSFTGTNSAFAATQDATIKLNGETILTNYHVLTFQQDGQEAYCLTTDFLHDIYIKDTYIKEAEKGENNHQTDEGLCLNMAEIIPEMSLSYNAAGNNMNIKIPQAYLQNIDPSWVRPSQRDSGINGLIFDYNLLWNFDNAKNSTGSRSSTTYTSVYGTLGANIGRFRIRGEYQYQSKQFENEDKLQWNQVYGYTDIASLNSKLYVGEIYSNSNVFDSVRIKGASMYSDESMMPSYLKGYAPEITGTAFSDAVVTVSQFGAILKRVQVPAGPFVISDLPSYVNGVVSVSIEENNGEIRTYEVEVSQVPFLTRKGSYRYNVSFGKIDPLVGTKVGTNLFSGDISYGLTSNISVFGGVQHTTNSEFQAINLGLGLNLQQFGALSFDVTHSKSDVKGLNDRRTGQSYRFNYAKRFSAGTTLNLAGYRFSSSGFRGVSDYISLKQYLRSDGLGSVDKPYYEKNRFSVSISQYIEPLDIYIAGTVSTGTYWNRSGTQSSYNLSIGKTLRRPGLFENTSLNLSLSQTDSGSGDKDKRIALFVSIPLGESKGTLSYNNGYSSSSKTIDQQLRYSNNGLGGNYSVGVNTINDRDFSGSIDYALTGYYYTNTRYGTITTSLNHTKDINSVRAGYNGSLTLTKHGLATHGAAYGPETSRLILDAGAPNVQLGNYESSLKSNQFGLIGVSSISPYSFVSYSVNNDNLPSDVQITDSVVNLAVDTGAIAYRSLGGIRGETALSIISLRDGSHPPFGAMVYRENGDNTEVAIVADGGLTYLMGLQPNHKYTVKWNGSSSCDLQISSLNPDDLKNLTCY